MRIELSSFVEGDLDAIAVWIARDNPTRAVTFLQEIRVAMLRVGENPFSINCVRILATERESQSLTGI